MRSVLDTNVLVSALLFAHSVPRFAFEKAARRGVILLSLATWSELEEVLTRPKFRKYFGPAEKQRFRERILDRAVFAEIHRAIAICRDPKDNMILELAVSGRADYIVTGDQDLLALDPFQGIRVVTPEAFLEIA